MCDLTEFFNIMGNGTTDKGYLLFQNICRRLVHAREKHPEFAKDALEGSAVIANELMELDYAIRNESEQRQFDEALDVIATAIRFANREFEK